MKPEELTDLLCRQCEHLEQMESSSKIKLFIDDTKEWWERRKQDTDRQRKLLQYEQLKQELGLVHEPTMAAEEMSGKLLGNYTILEKIGQGGMGQVFKAKHKRMNRTVAIKVLSSDVVKDKTAVRRFQREVEAIANLNHPNIVMAHDASEENGVHYLVMEYVEGNNLLHAVKSKGAFAIDEALSCILQVARGLEQAHKIGIIHRDIKPANLLLNKDGAVKILDMGLCQVEGRTTEQLTQSGVIMGTCDYMSPEQATDTKNVDARSDIYSLGSTLFFLLTGRTMYEGGTIVEKLMAHQHQPAPGLKEHRPDVMDGLDKVYLKMVAKKPSDRYQTMARLISDLETCERLYDVHEQVTQMPRVAVPTCMAIDLPEIPCEQVAPRASLVESSFMMFVSATESKMQ